MPLSRTEVEALGHHLHLRLLGSFAVTVNGEVVTLASPRLQTLLAYLALHRAEPQPRRRVAFLFWPDSTETQAQTNLRTLLHRLQAGLPHATNIIRVEPQFLHWAHDTTLTLDVAIFESALQQVATAQEASQAIAAIQAALATYTGDLLPDSYDEWVLSARDRLHQLHLDALHQLVTLLVQRRAYPAALPYARQLAQHDPLNEAARLLLIRLHIHMNDAAGALRAYNAYADTLRDELGAEPGAAIRQVAQQLLTSAPQAVPAQASTMLVGRVGEWTRLQQHWRAAAAGRPTLVVLAGEAGIGKTRLAEEWLRWAQREGATTAAAHCYAAEGDLAYAPVVTWLRSEPLRSGLDALDALWLSEVSRLLPELRATYPHVPAPAPLAEGWQRRQLFEALARVLAALQRPLLLLLDDLQWCDGETLAWLHYLLRFDLRAPLVVVATVRVEEVDASHPLVALFDALRHDARIAEYALGPLSPDETIALAQQVAAQPISAKHGRWIYAETEGNALFVVETVRASLEAGASTLADERARDWIAPVDAAASALPRGVHAVLARRLQQVSRPTADLLRVAAVIGRSFPLAVLSRAAALDDDTLVRGIDELCQRQIVRDLGDDVYDFTHDKLRTTAYGTLSTARRRLLHRRVADALAALHADAPDPVSGQIAVHFERAGLSAQAVAFYQRAAAMAQRVFANEEAIALLQRALSLCSAADRGTATELHELLGDMLALAGQHDQAVASYQHADDGVEHAPLMRARLLRKVGAVLTVQRRYPEAQRAAETAEQALGPAPGTADAAWWQEWVQLQTDQMMLYYWQGRADRIGDLVEKVRPVVERHGTPAQRAGFFKGLVLLHFRSDRYVIADSTLHAARQSCLAQREAGLSSELAFVEFNLGFTLLWRGELDESQAQLQAALALAERIGDVTTQSRCLTYLTVLERKRGNVAAVQTLIGRSVAVATAGQMAEYVGAAHGNAAWVAWRTGDSAAAARLGHAAITRWQALTITYSFEWTARWPLLAVALQRHALPEALEHARHLLAAAQQRPPVALEGLLDQAVQRASMGDMALAHVLLTQALDPAHQHGYL
ncbi:MAG: AAA family ATPase [Chloroflexales bacterium]|nr:AAA family ATPase [Chloroflexales bacterium]